MSSLALIHHSFGPYHFARAKRLVARHRGPVHLLQLATSEQLREWKSTASLPVRSASEGALEQLSPGAVSEGLRRLLDELNPDALVIAGYAHEAFRAAARWAKRHRKAAVLLSDSHAQDKRRTGVKELAKRVWLRRHFQTAFTAGALGAQYLCTLGFPAARIWRGYDVVDNDAFAAAAREAKSRAAEIRERLGLPERFFLYAGRMAPEKNVSVLLEAHGRLTGTDAPGLVLAGSGPELDAYRRRACSRVVFTGFVQEQGLAELYALCDALVLPSRSEPWGLVVNEAMACGAPVIVSSACGCSADLVFPGVNGLIVPPDDVAALTNALRQVASDEHRRREMGEASRAIIAPWSLDTWAAALTDCAEAAVRLKAP